MPNESQNKIKRTKPAPKTEDIQKIEEVSAPATVKEPRTKFVLKDIDPNQYVTVRNGFQGKLIYIAKRTGEKFKWDEFGDEQEMELSELKNAKSSNKKFFINNWFMFDEPWIIDYLGVNQYYRFAIKIEDFDKIFEMSPAEIEETLQNVSEGQKKSIAYRARTLISEERIDSNKVISTLERCLGVDLIEK